MTDYSILEEPKFVAVEDIILYRNRTTGYIDRVNDQAITDVTFVLM